MNKKIAPAGAIIIVLVIATLVGLYVWNKGEEVSSSIDSANVVTNSKKAVEINQSKNQTQKQSILTNSEIPGWKIYTNYKYGFEFQYPSIWTIKDDAGNILFGPSATTTSESGIGGIEFDGNLSPGQSLADFVKELNKNVELGSTSEKENVINGQKAVVSILPKAGISREESKSVSFVNSDDKVYSIYMMYHSELNKYPQDKENLKLFEKLFSTFKFTK
jgi:hypothetical protein